MEKQVKAYKVQIFPNEVSKNGLINLAGTEILFTINFWA